MKTIKNAKINFPIRGLKDLGFASKELIEEDAEEKMIDFVLQVNDCIRIEITKNYNLIGSKYLFTSDVVDMGIGYDNKVSEWAPLSIENIEKLKQFLNSLNADTHKK